MPGQPAGERKNMDKKDILSRVDHTLLSQTATWEEIRQILDDGIKYGCASACIPACYVKQAAEYVDGKLPSCTGIGFPNGYHTTATKIFETRDAVANGADEIDIVLNVGKMLEGHYDEVANEVEVIRTETSPEVVLKVIIESGALKTPDLIRKASLLSMFAGADFVKTSTAPEPPIRLTPAVACSPDTDVAVLWHIAYHVPELRKWLVANPKADAPLLELVSQRGGPGVRQALEILFESMEA